MDLYLSGGIFSSFVSSICKYPSHFNIQESWKIRVQCKGFIIYEHQQLVFFLSTLISVFLDLLSDLFTSWSGLLQAAVATMLFCVSIQNVLLSGLRPELRCSQEQYPFRGKFLYSLPTHHCHISTAIFYPQSGNWEVPFIFFSHTVYYGATKKGR